MQAQAVTHPLGYGRRYAAMVVLLISHQRTSHLSSMDANLVRASRQRLRLHQGVMRQALENPELGQRLLALGIHFHETLPAPLRLTGERAVDLMHIGRPASTNQRVVDLPHPMLPERVHQFATGGTSLGDQETA